MKPSGHAARPAPQAARSKSRDSAGKQERLQKVLASAGVASRRKAEELIVQGRVQVNGQVVTALGSKADPGQDHIRVDGKLIHAASEYRYYMLNKPKGYVTTANDPQGRPTVIDFFSRIRLRLFPVGRLDYASEGLLVMTNDGSLANTLTRASSHVPKTYLVKVSGIPTQEAIEKLRRGVSIPLGAPDSNAGRVRTAPAKVRLFRAGDNPWYEIVITEGRNRQLRKMFEEIGHHVEKIRRVEYGPLVLNVEPGEVRELTPQEVEALRRAVKPQDSARGRAPKATRRPVRRDGDADFRPQTAVSRQAAFRSDAKKKRNVSA
jgi:23S rRNA pseudouridine2605 synthase